MLQRLLFLFSFLVSASTFGARYECATEFGESVPVRLGDVALNEHVRALPGKSLVKRHEYGALCLETRYMKQLGPVFQFDLDCGGAKCEGALVGGELLTFAVPALYDHRVPGAVGAVTIFPAHRERFGLIARVFKSAVALPGGALTPVSSSGEFHFFREDDKFVFDVGVDEYLFISEKLQHRLAALEVKIRCQRTN